MKRHSKNLSKKVDKLVLLFTTMVEKLLERAREADEIRNKTIEKIEILEQECNDLKAVSERSKKLAQKISNLFEE